MPPEMMWFNDLTIGRFYCDWRRPAAGFRLEASGERFKDVFDGRPSEQSTGPWLVSINSPERQFSYRHGPLAQPDLYREFARLETDQEILGFANQYGLLTSGEMLNSGRAERVREWQEPIREMRFLVQIWDWVQARDRHRLEPFIWWTDEPRTVFRRFVFDGQYLDERVAACQQSRFRSIADPSNRVDYLRDTLSAPRRVVQDPQPLTDPLVLAPWKFGDVIEPAFDFVCLRVNRQARGRVSPEVLPRRNGDLYLRVDCLLSALWLQFQFAISGIPVETKQCTAPECTARIPRGRKYCDRCREERRRATKRATWHANKAVYRGEREALVPGR